MPNVPVRADYSFEMLRKRLSELPPGAVQEADGIVALLTRCWQQCAGSHSERMHSGKLWRVENLWWEPPVLSFTIDRHGRMGMGSTRAELQNWRVDLERKTARCEASRSYRQMLSRAETVKIEPLARELADSMLSGRPDERLRWQGSHTVRLLMAKIFPYGSGFKQTVLERRKRLRTAIGRLLSEKGWHENRRGVYCKAGV